MASKKDNGHDPLTVELVDLLKQVVGGIGRLAVQIQGTNERLDATNTRLDTLHEDVHELRAEVTSVKNEVRSLRGELHADLEEHRHSYDARLRALEEAVFKRAS